MLNAESIDLGSPVRQISGTQTASVLLLENGRVFLKVLDPKHFAFPTSSKEWSPVPFPQSAEIIQVAASSSAISFVSDTGAVFLLGSLTATDSKTVSRLAVREIYSFTDDPVKEVVHVSESLLGLTRAGGVVILHGSSSNSISGHEPKSAGNSVLGQHAITKAPTSKGTLCIMLNFIFLLTLPRSHFAVGA